MIFRKTSKGERGVLFNPKNYVADFGPFYRAFWTFSEKELQHNFSKMRGGAKAVWNLSENSSDLVAPSFPESYLWTKFQTNKSTCNLFFAHTENFLYQLVVVTYQ